LSRVGVTIDGVLDWILDRFIDHFQVVTTNNYNAIAISTLHILLVFSVCYYMFPGNGSNNG
jgi:hypothetical protein